MSDNTCKIIAISGGSGSGKTTLANNIMALFGEKECDNPGIQKYQNRFYLEFRVFFCYCGVLGLCAPP